MFIALSTVDSRGKVTTSKDFVDLRIQAIRVTIEDYIDTTASGGSNYSVHDTEVNSNNTHPG